MNTYSKFLPNVFLAKCTEKHEKGDIIEMSTKYGNEHECIVFNLIFEKEGYYYYSIVREDGFNVQEWARRKAERLQGYASTAKEKSNSHYQASHNLVKDIPLGQPILVGHHSEKAHRNVLEKSWNAMGKCVEESKKAESYKERAAYWEKKANTINLSMPESIEYFEFELEKAKAYHQGLKDGSIQREHSYSLTYASKKVNEIKSKYEIAVKLWA
jgi:hypothetical protein